MARRHYLCPVVEAEDPDGFGLTRQPKLLSISMPEGTSRSFVLSPDGTWALCVVSHPLGIPPIVDAEIDTLPDFAFDSKVSSMHTPTKTRMVQALQRRGIGTGFLAGTDGYREVVRHVGQLCDANFNEDGFGIGG